jgi:hypothetical protein
MFRLMTTRQAVVTLMTLALVCAILAFLIH